MIWIIVIFSGMKFATFNRLYHNFQSLMQNSANTFIKKALDSLENHYIVCSYGRMGKVICNELMAKGVPFVVIEKEWKNTVQLSCR